MALTLIMRSYQRLLPEQANSVSLEQGVLNAGRSPQSSWVILDPERVVSKTHFTVESRGTGYVLTDCSANGVFLNGAGEPLGKDNQATLRDGDRIRISDYDIEVVVRPAVQAPAGEPASPFQSAPEPLPAAPGDMGAPPDPLDLVGRSADPFAAAAEHTPQPAWPGQHGGGFGDPSEIAAKFEQVAPHQENFRPPAPAGQIPEDWDVDPASRPAPPVAERAPPPRAGPRAQQAAPPPQPAAAPPGAYDAQLLAAFLDGADLKGVQVPAGQSAETMAFLGAIFREVVQGLMEVLASRSQIKSEFRLSQTAIKPTDNNPLKFSLGIDDAMTALLIKRGSGYLPPVEAFRESFDDIKAHQMAVLAGMQVALHGLLQRFDPEVLAERIESDRGLGGVLGSKKARYWDAFAQLYQDIANEAEDDFHGLFGKEFARAYEEQIAKLRSGKR